MKKILILCLMSLLVVACGRIKPASCVVMGDLSNYFEVENHSYNVKNNCLTLDIRRLKDGLPTPWQEGMKMDTEMGSCAMEFTITYYDKNNKELGKEMLNMINAADQLRALAATPAGRHSTLTFPAREGAVCFRLESTFNMNGAASTQAERSSKKASSPYSKMSGAIGPYKICMVLKLHRDHSVTGAYYYKSRGHKSVLYLKGYLNGNELTLDEFTKHGHQSGSFTGYVNGPVYNGTFVHYDDYGYEEAEYSFHLNTDPDIVEPDLSKINYDIFR